MTATASLGQQPRLLKGLLAGLLYPFQLTFAFLLQLLRFKPNRITPGSYAVELAARWIGQVLAFFPSIFTFLVARGKQRNRFLNIITVMAPISACLSYFFLTTINTSFVGSFLELHFPEQLDVTMIKLLPL